MCKTVTSVTLLDRMRRGCEEGWTRFCSRYEPVILGLALRAGLQEQDARDVMQETLAAFVEAFRAGKYDRDRGRLRSYLQGFAIRKIQEGWRKRGRPEVQVADGTSSTAAMDRFPDEGTLTGIFAKEEERRLLTECLEEIRGQVDVTTFGAFELHVKAEWPAEKVASHMGMSVGAVYQATFRVSARLRKARSEIGELWERS